MEITKIGNKKFKTSFKSNIANKDVEVLSDKYLFDRNRTIGFRKDKKLFKFVGIRDGYSKQLEFTLKSVIIDGDEKIASNRVNFSELSLTGDTIVHNINDINFLNKVDLTNYRNLVEIEKPFTDIDITYEVHLKGVKIKNKKREKNNIINYISNQYDQFEISDEYNDNILFKIDKPFAYNKKNIQKDILSHELYVDDDILYYKKSVRGYVIDSLPLYIDANVTFNPTVYSNINSFAYKQSDDDSWADAHDGLGALSLNTNNSSIIETNTRLTDLLTLWYGTGSWIQWNEISGDPHKLGIVQSNGTSSYSYSSLKYTNSGETIIIDFPYNGIAAPNEYYPEFYVSEYDSGATHLRDTYYNITGTNRYIWEHTMGTDTQYFNLNVDTTSLTGLTNNVYFNTTGTPPGEISVYRSGITTDTTYYYESTVERQFLNFDTRDLYKISLDEVYLNFTLTSPSNGNYVIQKSNTNSDTSIITIDFNSYIGDPYATFQASASTHSINLGNDFISDFQDGEYTKLVIREENYDYFNLTPTSPYSNTITHNWSHQLDVYTTEFILTENTVLNFDIESDGFGVIYSNAPNYNDTYSGTTYTYVAHSSTSGTYDDCTSYTFDLTEHELYRTFMSFRTSILSIYDRYIIKSVKLVLNNINYNDDGIAISEGLQDTNTLLDASEFMSFGQTYKTVDNLTGLTEIELDGDVLNISGNTNFVIRNKTYDYEENYGTVGLITSRFGIDFSNSYLSVEIEPYKITGLNYIKAKKGEIITLYANKNTTDGNIYWATDSGMTNLLLSGNTYTFDTVNYNSGDYIYAAILDVSGNTISNNILSVYLDLYTSEYDTIPTRNYNVHDVDIDSVYFKYHKCLSGVTYVYARELDDVYEQNVEVSDGEGLGSYNMYNEFDVIDEFFSNSHEVEVAANLDDIDLSRSYKRIDEQLIHEGTRVLLFSTTPSENDGIYVADFNLKLKKIDELSNTYKAFRYKAHVNAGSYLDYEFHTRYYSDESELENSSFFLDGNIYGENVIDLDLYSDVLYDSNES